MFFETADELKRSKITLFGLSSTGKPKVWEGWVETLPPKGAALKCSYGYLDGKKQVATKNILVGKNIGKSNETTAMRQAYLQLESLASKKRDEGYSENIENANSVLLPMLAQSFKKNPEKFRYPGFAQRKLNGVRCLAEVMSDGTVKYISRKGKPFTTLDIFTKQILATCPVGTVLDGEMFNPNLPLNQIVSRIKRSLTSRENITSDPIQFHIYDFVTPSVSYNERFKELSKWFGESTENIFLVETVQVKNFEEIKSFHAQAIEQGYEGTILRNRDGLYKTDYRSYDLLKYKDYFEEDFKIIGVYDGTGKEEGQAIFICETSNGSEFNVRPMGGAATRRKWFNDFDNIKGELLTVRFQEWTEYHIPFHARGICIRNYE